MDNVGPEINVSLWLCNMNKKMTIILKKKRKKEGTRHAEQTNFET